MRIFEKDEGIRWFSLGRGGWQGRGYEKFMYFLGFFMMSEKFEFRFFEEFYSSWKRTV